MCARLLLCNIRQLGLCWNYKIHADNRLHTEQTRKDDRQEVKTKICNKEEHHYIYIYRLTKPNALAIMQ